MRKVTITKRMSDHEVKRRLREFARERGRTSPEKDLDLLVEELKRFEKQYGISTVEFYRKFCAGKMGDSMDVIEWAGLYEGYMIIMRKRHRARSKVATR
jgi:hypothetical protein